MDIGLQRRFIYSRDWIIEVDYSVAVISTPRTTLMPNTAAPSKLRPHQQRIDDQSRIDRHVDVRNSKLSLGAHFDLYDSHHVTDETAMHGDTPTGPSLCSTGFPPPAPAAAAAGRYRSGRSRTKHCNSGMPRR
jgi:hypothetical protein